MQDTFAAAPAGSLVLLRKRIGWLCHVIRLAALAYALWVLVEVVRHWADAQRVERGYGAWLRADLSGIEPWQQGAGMALHLAIWALAAAACYCVWRLFTGFLSGRIFTADAARWLQRVGAFGLAAEMADVFTRPLVSLIVSAHLPQGARMVGISFNPTDLLIVLFLCGFLALAHVFRSAVDIAHDNAQIV